MNIVIPGRELSQYWIEKSIEGLSQAVMKSFATRPMPSGMITEAECKRRTEIVEELWTRFYGRDAWAPDRVIDHMHRWLTARLDGASLDRIHSEEMRDPDNILWAPEALDDIEAERRLSALAVDSKGESK